MSVTRKTRYLIILALMLGILITLLSQNFIETYKYKKVESSPEAILLRISEDLFKRTFSTIIIKNISVGKASFEDLKIENIKITAIKDTYEVYNDREPDIPSIEIGIPYVINVDYEIRSVIKNISFIAIYNQDNKQYSLPSEIAILTKDREAEVLYNKEEK